MAGDPFEHFEEQQESVRLLDAHRDNLLAQARQKLAEDPAARVVGCVFAAATREAAAFCQGQERSGQPVPQGRELAGLMAREQAVQFLRAQAPAMLDWLDADGRFGQWRYAVASAVEQVEVLLAQHAR